MRVRFGIEWSAVSGVSLRVIFRGSGSKGVYLIGAGRLRVGDGVFVTKDKASILVRTKERTESRNARSCRKPYSAQNCDKENCQKTEVHSGACESEFVDFRAMRKQTGASATRKNEKCGHIRRVPNPSHRFRSGQALIHFIDTRRRTSDESHNCAEKHN